MAMPAKPFTRWTADTRTAFLLALRLHGTVREAADAIGRSAASAYKVRARDPGSAADWTQVVADRQAVWIATAGVQTEMVPREGRERFDGWTEPKRTRFLAMLARGESVTAACDAIGLSTRSAHYHRRQSPRFAAEWGEAIVSRGLSPIEAAYARGVEGWLEPVIFQGQVVAHKRRFSDAVLRFLLARDEARLRAATTADQPPPGSARRGSIRGATPIPQFAKREETDAVILRKLGEIAIRRKAEKAQAAIAFADRMVREGKAP